MKTLGFFFFISCLIHFFFLKSFAPQSTPKLATKEAGSRAGDKLINIRFKKAGPLKKSQEVSLKQSLNAISQSKESNKTLQEVPEDLLLRDQIHAIQSALASSSKISIDNNHQTVQNEILSQSHTLRNIESFNNLDSQVKMGLFEMDPYAAKNSKRKIKIKGTSQLSEERMQQIEAFYRRVMTRYVNEIMTQINRYDGQSPSKIRFPYSNQSELMHARLYFSKDGHLLDFENKKWATHFKLQDLFIDTVQNLKQFPNPPQMLVEKDGFYMDFILSIRQEDS